MIHFCDVCATIKTQDDFEEYYEYGRNTCKTCASRDPQEIDEEGVVLRRLDEMMFGEDSDDFEDPEDVLEEDDDDDDFIWDGDEEDGGEEED